jgi:hypothetical protein
MGIPNKMIILYFLCVGVTLYILSARGQANTLLVILAILFWPLALVAALMLPQDRCASYDSVKSSKEFRDFEPEEADLSKRLKP